MDWSIEKVNQNGYIWTFIFWIFLLAKLLCKDGKIKKKQHIFVFSWNGLAYLVWVSRGWSWGWKWINRRSHFRSAFVVVCKNGHQRSRRVAVRYFVWAQTFTNRLVFVFSCWAWASRKYRRWAVDVAWTFRFLSGNWWEGETLLLAACLYCKASWRRNWQPCIVGKVSSCKDWHCILAIFEGEYGIWQVGSWLEPC